ncbi:hypothetical protein M0811_01189 [Anaeramoeba ignava]|uniref:Uncharacterized protein n=1 Tax=Anaeramoeba ignava TaxID=1746090 RepID=A0A9Q0LNB6_ANAIG|nr:hypothetical protein M0811_01189 [Anaeramoeba ignava]
MLFLMKKEYIPDTTNKILSTKLGKIYDELIKPQIKDIFQSLFGEISTNPDISEDIIIQYLPIFIFYKLKVNETNEDIEKSNESFKKLLTFFFFENENQNEDERNQNPIY